MGMSSGVNLMALSTCSESSMFMYRDKVTPRKLTDSCRWISVISLDLRLFSRLRMMLSLAVSSILR